MRLYHGTTLKSANSIKKEGLKPEPSKAFNIQLESFGFEVDANVPLRKSEPEGFVYLSDDLEFAKQMARYRTGYERALPGEKVCDPQIPEDCFTKIDGKQDKTAKPALVTFDIPADMFYKMSDDPRDELDGYRYKGAIPASYIESVQEVPYDTAG